MRWLLPLCAALAFTLCSTVVQAQTDNPVNDLTIVDDVPGYGPEAEAGMELLVHYTGWTMDGKEFDSSHKKGQPLEYPINRFIPGWIEGLQLMVKGEKRKFWIPAKLAYEGMDGRPQGTLVFEVELLDFK